MIPLPHKSTDCIRLADWMELCALVAPDGDVSRDDLDSALRTAAVFPPRDEDKEIDDLVLAVFRELESRRAAAADGYSFELSLPTLKRKDNWPDFPTYVFCLCLSYFGERSSKNQKSAPRRLFEHVSRDAAIHYLGGDAVRFGWPRHNPEIPSKFAKAMTFLCTTSLAEGGGYKQGGLPYPKDSGIDIIAWKHFPDRAVGKLLLFGNCATEKDWDGPKKTELSPEAFCEEWMTEVPPSRIAIVKSLFIPHRCESTALASHTRRAGIIFDRCRIAYCCYAGCNGNKDAKQKFTDWATVSAWSRDQIQKFGP